ncbi:MAG: hypothetical protein ACTSO7_00875 [Candidatus Heimdallarchaeota archaeon]
MESESNTEIEYLETGQIKVVKAVTEPHIERYIRMRRNLQLVALILVLLITIVAPLNLLNSRTILDITAIGFITASFVPSLMAIFGFLPGRKIALIVSTFIYGVWILILSVNFLEIILMFAVLIFFFEITRMIITMEPFVKGITSVSEGGTYYHATITIRRYFAFLLRFGGFLFGVSTISAIIGWYAIKPIQGDIIFSIFLIAGLVILLIIAQRTLTPDMEKLILQKKRQQLEDDLSSSHKKFS